MGIKSLSKYLRDNHPDLFEYIHISEYSYKRVAIDISLYLYTYKLAFNNPDIPNDCSWLGAFIKLVSCLRENHIHCVFIYDSKATPDKDLEKQKRSENREKREQSVYNLMEALEHYHSTGEIKQLLFDFQEKRKIPVGRLLGTRAINIKGIEYAVKNMRKQLVKITSHDFEMTKELFKILNVPFYDAPVEAETTCAELCIQGKVDAVLSEDTDVLAYGAPVFLTKINTTEATCMRIRYSEVLKLFNFTSEQFLDFCIMCGTDYNSNIPRVGPSKAYSLISEHKTIEGVRDGTKHDTSILNYERGRQLFREYERVNWNIPYCGTPDFSQLEQFIFKKQLRVPIDSLRKSFENNIIVFEE